MLTDLKLYATCIATIVVVDFVWIGLLMKNFYVTQFQAIGRIQGGQFKPVLWAVGVVYLLLAIGIVQIALPRVSSQSSWMVTFGIGALFGFVVYGVYDFTNYATLKDFSLTMALVDLGWGTFLCGICTMFARLVRDL